MNFALFIYLFIYSWKKWGILKIKMSETENNVILRAWFFFFFFFNLINKYRWGQNPMGTYYKPYKSLIVSTSDFAKL